MSKANRKVSQWLLILSIERKQDCLLFKKIYLMYYLVIWIKSTYLDSPLLLYILYCFLFSKTKQKFLNSQRIASCYIIGRKYDGVRRNLTLTWWYKKTRWHTAYTCLQEHYWMIYKNIKPCDLQVKLRQRWIKMYHVKLVYRYMIQMNFRKVF